MVASFGASKEPSLRKSVAGALINKGIALWDLGRTEEAIITCDDVIARFEDSPEPVLQEMVAKAHELKAQIQ